MLELGHTFTSCSAAVGVFNVRTYRIRDPCVCLPRIGRPPISSGFWGDFCVCVWSKPRLQKCRTLDLPLRCEPGPTHADMHDWNYPNNLKFFGISSTYGVLAPRKFHSKNTKGKRQTVLSCYEHCKTILRLLSTAALHRFYHINMNDVLWT